MAKRKLKHFIVIDSQNQPDVLFAMKAINEAHLWKKAKKRFGKRESEYMKDVGLVDEVNFK